MTTQLSQQEANKYLRDEAMKAHLDGEGAKARHLAAIALMRQTPYSKLPVLPFKDMFWAFSILIYWMLDANDYTSVLEPAWYAFGRQQKFSDNDNNREHKRIAPIAEKPEEHWYTLIHFLLGALNLLHHSNFNDCINRLEKIPREFFSQEMEPLEIEILSFAISLVIEFIFIISPGKITDKSKEVKWKWFSTRWESYAQYNKLDAVYDMLSKTRKRLERQHKCLIYSVDFDDKTDDMLEKFWKAFYDLNSIKMNELVNEITKLTDKDKDKFYVVQGLINMSRWLRKPFSDQFFGVYRIQRLYMENQRPLFNKLRKIKFEEILSDIRYHAEEHSKIHFDFDHLLRLSFLTEIMALQNWELGGYLDALKMKSKTLVFSGLFPADYEKKKAAECNPTKLHLAVFYAVKGIGLQTDTTQFYKDIHRAILHLEVNKKGKEEISSIVESLIEDVRPIEIVGTMRVFKVLSDAIPEKYLSDIFTICIKASKKRNFDLKSINWWKDIFAWRNIEKKHWNIVDPILTECFTNPATWSIIFETLTEALLRAPISFATKWAKSMLDITPDDAYRQYGYAIIFNVALERDEIKEFALHFIEPIKHDNLQKVEAEYNRLLLELPDRYDTEEEDRYRLALIEACIKYSKSIAERKTKPMSFGFGGEPTVRNYLRVEWSNLDEKKWVFFDEIARSAMINPYIFDREFLAIARIWTMVASQQGREIINNSGRWLFDRIMGGQFSFHETDAYAGSPFSSFTSQQNIVEYAKGCVALFLPHVSSELSEKILLWLQELIPDTEQNLPLLWGVLLKFYVIGNRDYSSLALNAIKAIYIRFTFDADLLAEGVEKLYYVLIDTDNQERKKIIDLLKNMNCESVLTTLDKTIERLIFIPNPDARKAAALVISLLDKTGLANEQRRTWAEILRNDPRARVFKVFENSI
ncbi:MAG: hypothetical protein GY795_51195 [Desulfobacterales bacterium]|nr:hypothetical protein [Desulfobacterales bacterium]